MISITIEANTAEEMMTHLQRLSLGAQRATSPAEGHGIEQAPEATERPKRGRPAKVEEPPKKLEEAPKTAEKAPASAAGGPPFKDVAEKVATLVAKVGKPEVVKLLASFSVKRAGELKPEQYGPFLAAANKLLS